ncbi:DUF1647 domain-containing protein [Ekhidna sp.]|uniref:DUF1647 domain-containing protein n=1 Tax=Ekhidna sp. TaxID=2608089 RepID=UPI00329A3430
MSEVNNYIVTAANNTYFKNFCQLMYSFMRNREFENSTVIFYDLGLDDDQADELKSKSNRLFKYVAYRKFDFDSYPEFVKPKYSTYSWKPLIIHEVFNEKKGNIFWKDSANQILKNMKPVWDEMNRTGTYIPYSGSGTLKEWTIQATMDYLNVPDKYYAARNRAGNTCGFSYANENVRKLIQEWKDLALVRECIRPEGANRSNHRDDQSLLTILLLIRDYGHALDTTDDEVDISSSSPTPYLSVRNRFPSTINLEVGAIAYHYFNFLRFIDIISNKIQRN